MRGFFSFYFFSVFIILIGSVFSCKKTETTGEADRVTEVSAPNDRYETALSVMQSIKAGILADVDTYEMAIARNKNIIDRRKAHEAVKSIIVHSEELMRLANRNIEDREVIRQVSSSFNTYKEYRDFASEMKKKFENIE